MGDGDEFGPAALVCRLVALVDIAFIIDGALERNAEIMRTDGRELVLQLVCSVEGGAAQHDCHAAADWRAAGQRVERIRPRHPHLVRIDAQHLADHRADQRLVALAG